MLQNIHTNRTTFVQEKERLITLKTYNNETDNH